MGNTGNFWIYSSERKHLHKLKGVKDVNHHENGGRRYTATFRDVVLILQGVSAPWLKQRDQQFMGVRS